MNAELMFEACSYIDETLLAKSEKRRPNLRILASVAASIAAILLGTSLLFIKYTPIHQEVISCYPDNLWTITYNQTSVTADESASLKNNYFCLYGETLNAKELNTIAPDLGSSDIRYSGHSTFGPSGLEWVEVEITDPTLPSVTVQLSEKEIPNLCYSPDTVVSQVGGEDGVCVVAYETSEGEVVALNLTFQLNDRLHIKLFSNGSRKLESQMKQRFSDIIACYVIDKKDLTLDFITSNGIPNIRREELSFSEAQKDEDFGGYFLKELPQGFVGESVIRIYHPENDGLHGLWTQNYSYLDWKVSRLKEADKARLTSVRDVENYDLDLYPIPRAESVPDELREMVDNPIFRIEELTLDVVQKRSYRIADAGDTDGERMHFSVLFDDVVVEVSAKGVSSGWIYEQLITLK